MSETNTNPEHKKLSDLNLQKMEALLNQSAKGFHVLFDNESIARALTQNREDKELFDFEQMKKIQDIMTELIAKPTYLDKVSYLNGLDEKSYQMLIRTYFHIVDNTVKASGGLQH